MNIPKLVAIKYTIIFLAFLVSSNGYGQNKISPEDLSMLIGSWEGSITYLDYQTNNPFTMPANLIVKKGKSEDCLKLNNLYPNEPKANNSEKFKITKRGTRLNKNLVISRKDLENGRIQIQTKHNGKDDNQKALIRYTYILSEALFSIKKEVQFESSTDWIKRSEFNYDKKK